jgi:hypothetical protein
VSVIHKVVGFASGADVLSPPVGATASAELQSFRAFVTGLDLRNDGMWYLMQFRSGTVEVCCGSAFSQVLHPTNALGGGGGLDRVRPEYGFLK